MPTPTRSRNDNRSPARAFSVLVAVIALSLAAALVGVLEATPASAVKGAVSVTAKPCGGQKLARKPGGGVWRCTFDEEFTGRKINPKKWVIDRTASNGLHVGSSCLVNNRHTVSQRHGLLTLSVVDTGRTFRCIAGRKSFTTRYIAGSINTYQKFKQLYGRFQIRARFPRTAVRGLVSSLWLFPVARNRSGLAAFGDTGEIDIAEHYSQYADREIPYAHAVLVPTSQRTSTKCKLRNPGGFHTYVLLWTRSRIKISYDGTTCIDMRHWIAAPAPFNTAELIALTTGVGIRGNAPTAATPMPAHTQVDYVRVWR